MFQSSNKCKIMSMDMDSIKSEIKVLLAKKCWTQVRLAKELGLRLNKKYSAKNLENKLRYETIQYREIKLIADILGLKIEFKEKD